MNLDQFNAMHPVGAEVVYVTPWAASIAIVQRPAKFFAGRNLVKLRRENGTGLTIETSHILSRQEAGL